MFFIKTGFKEWYDGVVRSLKVDFSSCKSDMRPLLDYLAMMK